jgi:MFS family permease
LTGSRTAVLAPVRDFGDQEAQRHTWLARRLRDILIPHDRAGRQLSLIALVDAIGTGMYYTGSALYFTTIVGLAPRDVGTGLALGGVAGLVLTVPVGVLVDRVGAGRVLIGLQLWRAACYVAFCLVSNAPQFMAVAACIGVADGATPPNHQAVVSGMVPESRRVDTLAKVRALRNVGFGTGALAATLAISDGSRAGYLILVAGNAVSFLVTAALLGRIGAAARAPRTFPVPARGGGTRSPLPRRYLGATVLNGVLCVHMTVLALGLPLWVAGHTRVPALLIGPLIAGNTVLAVLLQARFARPAAELPGALRCAVRAALALSACAVALQLAGLASGTVVACAAVICAVVLLTCAELWQSAAGWTISYELAPAAQRARYLSIFQLGTSLQAIAAPVVITGLVLPNRVGWLTLGAVVLACGLAVPRVVQQRRPPAGRHRRPGPTRQRAASGGIHRRPR